MFNITICIIYIFTLLALFYTLIKSNKSNKKLLKKRDLNIKELEEICMLTKNSYQKLLEKNNELTNVVNKLDSKELKDYCVTLKTSMEGLYKEEKIIKVKQIIFTNNYEIVEFFGKNENMLYIAHASDILGIRMIAN